MKPKPRPAVYGAASPETEMKFLTLSEAATILEAATIIQTIDAGHAITHIGITEAGAKFVMVNDMNGNTTITEA